MKGQVSRKTTPTQGNWSGSRRHSCNDRSKLKGHVDEAAELMRKVANDDFEAFDCLYRRFYPIVKHSFANYDGHHISSDDCTQEVFTRLWQMRKSFKGESLFITYLLSMARHILNEKMRQTHKMVRIEYLKQVAHFTMDSHNGLSQPESELYLRELTAVLVRIQAMLTAEQRQALEISQDVDVSLAGMAWKLGCSREAFRSRLKRARKRTQELLVPILESE